MPNAVKYAEDELGVHTVYEEATQAHADLLDSHGKMRLAEQRGRAIQEQIKLREFDLAHEYRARYTELSNTAFRDMMKDVYLKDDDLIDLRRTHDAVADEASSASHAARAAEMRLQMHVARMHELSGLLYFYAAARQAKPTTPTTPVSPT